MWKSDVEYSNNNPFRKDTEPLDLSYTSIFLYEGLFIHQFRAIHFGWMCYNSLLTCNVYGQQINESQCNTALSITDHIPYVRSESDPAKLDRVNDLYRLNAYTWTIIVGVTLLPSLMHCYAAEM